MKSLDLSALTLSDLADTFALDSIRHAAEITGRAPEAILAEVVAEPLDIGEMTIALQCRADALTDDAYQRSGVRS